MTVVTAGTAGGQIALGLSLPLIAVLYDAAEVGVFALALAAAQLGAIVVTGRVEQVLPRLVEGERWAGLRVVGLAGLLGLLALGVIGFAAGAGTWLVAVLVLLASVAVTNVAGMAVLAEREFSLLARMRLVNGVVTAACQVLGGLLLADATTLVVGYAVGNLVAAALATGLVRRVRHRSSGVGGRSLVRTQALDRFALTVGGSAALSSMALALPVAAMGHLFGAAVVGSFFIARKLLMVPTQLVASTASEVTYAMVATEPPAVIRRAVARWLRTLRVAAMATLAVGVLLAVGVELVVPEGYVALGQVTLLLTVPAAAQLVATSLSNVLLALHQERIRLQWNVGRLLGLVVLFVALAAVSASYVVTVAALAAYLTVTYGVLLWLTLRALRRAGGAS